MNPTIPPVANGGATAPGLVCSRWVGDHACGKPAIVHVAWTPELDNGLVCVEHEVELGSVWAYWDKHAYNPMCSIPGAQWCLRDDGSSFCVVPDIDVLAVHRALEAIA